METLLGQNDLAIKVSGRTQSRTKSFKAKIQAQQQHYNSMKKIVSNKELEPTTNGFAFIRNHHVVNVR